MGSCELQEVTPFLSGELDVLSRDIYCNERQNIIEENECMMGLKIFFLIEMREEERCLPN